LRESKNRREISIFLKRKEQQRRGTISKAKLSTNFEAANSEGKSVRYGFRTEARFSRNRMHLLIRTAATKFLDAFFKETIQHLLLDSPYGTAVCTDFEVAVLGFFQSLSSTENEKEIS
jgi:hypothetical protein